MSEEPFIPEPSCFNERLVLGNNLAAAGFAAWEFLPGMRFAERAAWWRGGAQRAGAHEGLDIRFFRSAAGKLLSLGPGARVPAAYAGEVVSLVEDFLGVSVFVAHEPRDSRGRQLHTVYGHVSPRRDLAAGSRVGGGEEIGTIADQERKGRLVPAHLHLTLALIDREAVAGRLDWGSLREGERVVLIDPLIIMK